jgi:hypothetical protein
MIFLIWMDCTCLSVYGDYIASRNQTNRKLATEAAAMLFQDAGGISAVVSLPEDSLVFGNSHIAHARQK